MKRKRDPSTSFSPVFDRTEKVQVCPQYGGELTLPRDGLEQISPHTHAFAFHELEAATMNFLPQNFLGEGGFGRVYKGQLETTGQVVAVKQLKKDGKQGNREFLVEVLMLSLLDHPNLVNLVGYCADGDQRLLVYEFMSLGSLADHLFDLPPNKEGLDWNTRMKIAAGAAKGLAYLHNEANPPVIYRDFKSANILLDEGFRPKLSDFGLAKHGPTGDKTHVSTRVMGTYGYCAPDYAMSGQLTLKSDVWSFGVVFLELITGRKAIDKYRPSKERSLVVWASTLSNNTRNLARLADPKLKGRFPAREHYQALVVAFKCLQEQDKRPLIAEVVRATSYLANQANDPSKDEKEGGSGRRYDQEGAEKDETPREPALIPDVNRDRAVAEARMWGERYRQKRRQSEQGTPRRKSI